MGQPAESNMSRESDGGFVCMCVLVNPALNIHVSMPVHML